MPPKPAITEERILDAAFEQVQEMGWDSLTARSIAQRLRCSTQPIYSVCGSMEELRPRVYQRAVDRLNEALTNDAPPVRPDGTPLAHQLSPDQAANPSLALKLAIRFLQFARQERHLFHLLHLSGYRSFDPRNELLLSEALSLESMRHSSRVAALAAERQRQLFLKLSIYLVGLGTMLYSGTLQLTMEEATAMVQDMYEILIRHERSEIE